MARTYPGQELHLIVDNYHTHKHAQVNRWLERHKRVHLLFTLTNGSWMNQVEIWFSLLHRRALHRGVFKSVSAVKEAIQRFLDAWNDRCRPLVWVKPADRILARADRQRSSEAGH